MKKLFVYADFDWLKETEPVGELHYEYLRGADCYGFKFCDSWLKRYGAIPLAGDLNNYTGMQYTLPGNDIFGCFSDALPDRWGQTLLKRREQLETKNCVNWSKLETAMRKKFWLHAIIALFAAVLAPSFWQAEIVRI